MNVRVTSSLGDNPLAKYGKRISKKKVYGLDITCHIEVKVQGRIWIMNVPDTSSYGDTPMCQIW